MHFFSGSCLKADDGRNVARNCFSIKVKEECMNVASANVCYCNTDKCNNANSMSYSIAALLAVFVVITFNK